MSLRVAIQMDPVESIDIRGDTSFALGLEAQKRGHELHYYLPDSLTLADIAFDSKTLRVVAEAGGMLNVFVTKLPTK